jgi:YfiH family protein
VWSLDVGSSVPAWRLADEPPGTRRLAFSTRTGGISAAPYATLNLGASTADRPEAVAENRRRLLQSLDLDFNRLVIAGQVHGAAVAVVSEPGLARGHDGLVTRVPGLPLAVSSADCLPILFTAPGAIAAAHAGWRGTVAGIAEATLEALCRSANVGPDQVRVHLGPCIRDCCYAVGPEVATLFPTEARREVGGRTHVSVPAAVTLRLRAAGVPADAVVDVDACTSCEPSWYFSHRRDQGLTGRHWGIAALRDDG